MSGAPVGFVEQGCHVLSGLGDVLDAQHVSVKVTRVLVVFVAFSLPGYGFLLVGQDIMIQEILACQQGVQDRDQLGVMEYLLAVQ